MARILDFQWRKAKKTLEELSKTLVDLESKAQALQEKSNVVDLSDKLQIKKLHDLPKKTLAYIVVAHHEGLDAFENHDFEKAAEIFGALVGSNYLIPGCAEYFELAYSLYKTGRAEDAISACHEGISEGVSEKSKLYLVLADCYADQETLEGLDNARYCIAKAQELINEKGKFLDLLKVLHSNLGIKQHACAIVGLEHKFDDINEQLNYTLTLQAEGKSYNVLLPITIVDEDGNEFFPRSLPEDMLPQAFKVMREACTQAIGKSVYFSDEILEREGVQQEDISYRTFERD